ncbi:Zn-ribbon domain-containing OB-fold protein [Baekduia sp. Peel2402]|uniref:Zn-ribbon domain-containing OB-fold protein n=1 Tax=Baekduia sp. Peel2402 TaxID=3458296 RepID=UPI00403EB20F
MERAPTDVYWDHCRRQELAYQVDTQGRPVFPPRVGDGLQWRVSAGRGTVYAVTVAHPRGESDPYNIVLVDLDEGFRMMSAVDGDEAVPIVIGARVEVAWREGDPPVPVFVAAEAAA